MPCTHPEARNSSEVLDYLRKNLTAGKHVIILTPWFKKTVATKVIALTDTTLPVEPDNAGQTRFYRKHLPEHSVIFDTGSRNWLDPEVLESVSDVEPVCHVSTKGKKMAKLDAILISLLRKDLSVFVYRETSFDRLYDQLFDDLLDNLSDRAKDFRRILHLFFDKSIGIQFKLSNKRQLYINRVVEIADHHNNKLSTKVIYEYHESTKQYLKKG